MKIKKGASCLAAAVGVLTLTGCSHGQSAQLENEITFSLDNISEVTISYDEEKVTFYESGNLEMSLNALRFDSTAGTVQLNTVDAQSLYLSTTRGVLDVDNLNADTIRIATTSGNFSCEKLDGNVTYTTASGNTDIKSAIGSGNYKANNPSELNVVYTEVTGDLSFYNKNDSIHVTLPADLEFEFEDTAKNGSIYTTFQENVSIEGRTTSSTVGEYPTVTVKVETNNENIEVEQ